MKLSLTIIFLQNICFKGKVPLLKNDVCFALLFHSYRVLQKNSQPT